jgi:DNA-binding GntR family transcriptional regulator
MTRLNKDICLADLKLRILSTDLAPGCILDEASLVDRYGVSRTPLREVLHRLEGAGYIVSEENRSAKVVSMDLSTMRTFFLTAPMIYANIARLAAENRTIPQLENLKAAQKRFSRAVKKADGADAAMANHDFHATIGVMANNLYLLAALDRLLIDHTRMSQTFYRPKSSAEVALTSKASQQHDAMIAAIENGDGALAVELTLQHWDLSRDRLERFVRPDPLPIDVASLKDHQHAI